MPDIIATPATLITEFADNTTGLITAQFGRNLIESSFGSFQSVRPVNLNILPQFTGAVVGAAGGSAGSFSGTLPTDGNILNQGNLVLYVAAVGISSQGFPYWDLNISGTTSTTSISIFFSWSSNKAPVTPSLSHTVGIICSYSAGSLVNITSADVDLDCYTSLGDFAGNPIDTTITLTNAPQGFSGVGTLGATAVAGNEYVSLNFSSGVAINVRLRFANPQVLLTSTATTYTAVFADRGTTKKINSPNAFTVTIPSAVFAPGNVFYYRQMSAGTVTVAGDGTSVLVSSTGTYTTRAEGSLISVTADADVANLFWVDGDLT